MEKEYQIYKCPVCSWSHFENEVYSDWEHCPNCLSSIHAADKDGFECGGTLEPISIWVKPDGTWDIIQRCRLCGELNITRMSEDDSPLKVLSIASSALAVPPFPIEKMEELTKAMGGQGDVGGYYREQRK